MTIDRYRKATMDEASALADAGANVLTGLAGNDTLDGRAGNDKLEGGGGTDTLQGGAGSDTASYASAATAVTVSLAVAGAQATGGAGYDTLISMENLTGSSFNDVLSGNRGANTLTGRGGDDTLNGGAGADTMIGGTGNDTLNGRAGADTMIGGANNDTYYVDYAGDVVTEAAAGGIADRVITTLSRYTLGAEIESLTFTGTGNIVGMGNGLANRVIGGAGKDNLTGLGDNDTLPPVQPSQRRPAARCHRGTSYGACQQSGRVRSPPNSCP